MREEESKSKEESRLLSGEKGTMKELVAQIDSEMTTCCPIMPPIGKQSLPSMSVARANEGTIRCIRNRISCTSTIQRAPAKQVDDVVQRGGDAFQLV